MAINDILEAASLLYKAFTLCSPHIIIFSSILTILISGLVFYGRNTSKSKKQADKFFETFLIGGHRGAPKAFPENSFAGFEQAKKDGMDLIEFDISLTKDNVAVLLHDDDLDRTTNLKGMIREKTHSELSKADISATFVRTLEGDYDEVKAEGLPTLEETVKWSVDNNMIMLFDVKDSDHSLVLIISELFERYNLFDKAIVCSFFPIVTYRIKRINPNIVTGLTWRRTFFSYGGMGNKIPKYRGLKQIASEALDFLHVAALKRITPWFLGADLLLTSNDEISRGFVEQQRASGRYVVAWTVNDMNEMKWMIETLRIPILTDFPHLSKQIALNN